MFVNGKTLVRTRFAPSPTGYLHIGGARTALFNYLYARRYGGSFVLRIDDTDLGRNIDLAVKPIMDGLKWLGVNWDEGPIFQSVRKDHYREIAQALIKMGHAYPDNFNAPEEPTGKKAYRGQHRNLPGDTALELYDDTEWSIRYKVPEDEDIVLDDLIKGEVKFNTSRISDPVIIRSNGTPTYNFATVVDDAEMKITHVIRADEHLSNTPVQLLLMYDLGYTPPFYAHVPYVCEPGSNKKLSKRDIGKFITPEIVAKLREIGYAEHEIEKHDDLNPATLSFYTALGYKPQAVANYLARLGWSLDGETEIMSMKQMQDNFSLDRVGGGPAQFDPKKLLWTAGEHTKTDNLDTRTNRCTEYLIHGKVIDPPVTEQMREKIKQVVEICGERIKVYSDILPYGAFFFRRPVYHKKDVDKHIDKDMAPILDIFVQHLKQVVLWNAESLEDRVREFMDGYGLKPNKMIYALRVAISGNMIGPSLFHSLEFLGKEECIARCNEVMKVVPKEIM